MAFEKIALIIDSCTDVIPEYVKKFKMYSLPVTVNYKDGSYRDNIDISTEEVIKRLPHEIPSTSLPSPALAGELLDKVIADGFKKAVVVTISSGLSGTYNTVRMMLDRVPQLEYELIDTKNIGLGAGFTAMRAAELIEQGTPFAQLRSLLEQSVLKTKVFFSVTTLKYLHAGGRIGEVTYRMGSLLDASPVISCNEKGVYYTARMARGRTKALKKAVDLAQKVAEGFAKYNVAVVHAGALDESEKILARVGELFPHAQNVFKGQISSALVVHTGPGLVGIGVQGLS
ncbi:MAG: DegV family protein [Coriobacteriales bacterium]|jgi:DegV family protein with EDD domain|nr:DegV family protein [Coriobacteriales bacterium]